jgi:uncharacterized protein (DUF58 family)
MVWVILGGVVAVFVAAVLEYILLTKVRVKFAEQPFFVLSLDEEEEISIKLTTDSRKRLQATMRVVWPDLLSVPSSTMRGICLPGQVLRLESTVRSRSRGVAVIEGPFVSITFWAFAERVVQIKEKGQITVVPNLRAVRRYHDQLNEFVLRGMGQRIVPRLGKGREFDRLRDYNINDDYRDIAWKASARHNELIVREYRIERSQDVLICLDRGHRMAALTTRIRRIDHAVNSALLVSYICNRMEDRVGMLTFGSHVERGIQQGRGAGHLRKLTNFANSVEAEYVHTDYVALGAHVKTRQRHRALVIILTALPESGEEPALVRAVNMLLPTHLPLVVVLSDPALSAAAKSLPADKMELCRALAARDVWEQRNLLMVELRRKGAWVIDTGPDEAGINSINAYLEIKRRQLL